MAMSSPSRRDAGEASGEDRGIDLTTDLSKMKRIASSATGSASGEEGTSTKP